MQQLSADLIQKYNVPAPRYTSYPPVPFWKNNLTETGWMKMVKKAYQHYGANEGISLYIHLPYCESLCTYCGCNKRITTNHKVELPYISTIMKEWSKYLALLPDKPKIAGIHLGGGTPTFFSEETLKIMLQFIRESAEIMENAEFSFEGHPNNTTKAHLETLYDLGFRRVSFGIQDFDNQVQKAIHRIQPFEKVEQVTQTARSIGYHSVNFDLIYGLPHQTLETIEKTFDLVAGLKPDRIAFYSYAHLPSAFPSQRIFEKFLPTETEKRALYEKGKNLLGKMGYEEIGMDHFSLPKDPLFVAKEHKTLHRNFMGYTTSPSKLLIGLGNSAISDIHYGYAQNEKKVETYKNGVVDGHFPISKGHVQTERDIKTKQLILELICNQQAQWPTEMPDLISPNVSKQLSEFQKEGLLKFDAVGIVVLEKGIALIRNICMIFDHHLQADPKEGKVFSKSI